MRALEIVLLPLTIILAASVVIMRGLHALLWLLWLPSRIAAAIFGVSRSQRRPSPLPRQYIVASRGRVRSYTVQRM